MFKTDLGIKDAYNKLVQEEGAAFLTRYVLLFYTLAALDGLRACINFRHLHYTQPQHRGIASNMTAVAFPLAITIFVTDLLLAGKDKYSNK